MEFHGVTKPIVANLEFTPIKATEETAQRLPGDILHVRATFPLDLSDFGVVIPAVAKLKIAEVQNVTVDIFASTQKLSMPTSDAPKEAPKDQPKS